MATSETVTVLMTDIVGSTRLWSEHSAAMSAAMARHNSIVAEVVAAHGGELPLEQGEGDSRLAVFTAVSAGLAAAITLARRLADETWPAPVSLRARMALHTGEVLRDESGVHGDALNRCARLRAIGHGGQLLVSEAAARLLRDRLPAGVTLRDLGQHVLKDRPAPEHVLQVDHPALDDEFPPLRSLESVTRALPVQLSSFVGRDRERLEVMKLLAEHRLVTVTGFGGMGKTRLAVAVAEEAPAAAVFFVDLAPVAEADAVLPAVAAALGVRVDGPDPLPPLAVALGGRATLVVLDNCEQVVGAAPSVAALLQAAPDLRVLATSREPFHMSGEQVYPLSPLGLPEAGDEIAAAGLADFDAVRLFLDRARELRPDLVVSGENASRVVAICSRLDGLPLAIELAAARISVLSPAALLTRLEASLDVLTGGPADRPARHQTMRAAIDWSVQMLAPEPARLLERMSVFVNPADLAAIEAVGGGPVSSSGAPLDILGALSTLVDRSLVRRGAGLGDDATYALLVPIREYASERLSASGELDAVRDRHADYFAARIAALAPDIDHAGGAQAEAAVRASLDDFRGAAARLAERSDPRMQVEIAVDFAIFTYTWSVSEAFEQLAAAERRWARKDPLGAMVLSTMSMLSGRLRSDEETRAWANRALTVAEEAGDPYVMAFAMQVHAWSQESVDDLNREVIAAIEFAESIDRSRPFRWGGVDPLVVAADIRAYLSRRLRYRDPVRASEVAREHVAQARAVGHRRGEAYGLINMAACWMATGAWKPARAALIDARGLLSEFSVDDATAFGGALGQIAAYEHDLETAIAILRDASAVALRTGHLGQYSDWAPSYGEALHLAGETGAAEAAWQQALGVAHPAGWLTLEAKVHWRQARAMRLAGDLQRASALAVQAWPRLLNVDGIANLDVLGCLVELAAQAHAVGDAERRDLLLGSYAARRGPFVPPPCTLIDLKDLPDATPRPDVELTPELAAVAP